MESSSSSPDSSGSQTTSSYQVPSASSPASTFGSSSASSPQTSPAAQAAPSTDLDSDITIRHTRPSSVIRGYRMLVTLECPLPGNRDARIEVYIYRKNGVPDKPRLKIRESFQGNWVQGLGPLSKSADFSIEQWKAIQVAPETANNTVLLNFDKDEWDTVRRMFPYVKDYLKELGEWGDEDNDYDDFSDSETVFDEACTKTKILYPTEATEDLNTAEATEYSRIVEAIEGLNMNKEDTDSDEYLTGEEGGDSDENGDSPSAEQFEESTQYPEGSDSPSAESYEESMQYPEDSDSSSEEEFKESMQYPHETNTRSD